MVEPRVLVLDEATSTVDLPTEGGALAALRRLLAGRAAMLISHRVSVSTLPILVAVVEDGRVVELGTCVALLAAVAPQ